MKTTRSILLGLWLSLPVVHGQGTAFTYQGLLSDNGAPAHGSYDLTFTLYDALTMGNVLGGPLTNAAVSISNGLFAVRLDFDPNLFDGAPSWLEIGVRTNDGVSAIHTLDPRQPMTATPYAITARNVIGVLSSSSLAGTYGSTVYLNNPANQLSGTFTGDGAGITNVNATSLSSGLLPSDRLTGVYSSPVTLDNAANSFSGGFMGNGAALTNLNAGSLTAGALPGAQLAGTYSNAVNFSNGSNSFTGSFAGNGVSLGNLNAANLTGTLPGPQLAGLYSSPVNLNNAANSFAGNGGALSNVNAAMLQGLGPSAFWQLSGNTGTMPGSQFLGTADNQALELKVNGTRALRLEPTAAGAPNVIGGAPLNAVDAASVGATISGGRQNSLNSSYGTIAGGEAQTIGGSAPHATIGGGGGNNIQISSSYATIGGGQNNLVQTNSDHSMVGGGLGNAVNGFYTSIVGGQGNTVAARYATIGGGAGNGVVADAQYAGIGGGQFNAVQANATWGTIAGGSQNAIGPGALAAAIGGGSRNVVRTNAANAVIPGGSDNLAGGEYAFAAGRRAKASHHGAFVWADSSNADFVSTNQNSFSARAVGGFRFASAVDGSGNATAGVALEPGATAWATLSDRQVKKNFAPVDVKAVVEKLAKVPVQRWNYQWESDRAVPHLGPTAQDFKRAFYPGREDKHLTTQEVDGVALAAIQGLNELLKEKEAEIRGQQRELELQRNEIEQLKQAVAELKAGPGH